MLTNIWDKAVNNQYIQEAIQAFSPVRNIINLDYKGPIRELIINDMQEIIACYGVYEEGAGFATAGKDDIVPSNTKFRQISDLIDKQARFMFSNPPKIEVKPLDNKGNVKDTQQLVSDILEKNHFTSRLLAAAKDCFIGKRVAIVVDFDDSSQNIDITIIPSLEFVHEYSPEDQDVLIKFTRFYQTVTENKPAMYKKVWDIENGMVYVEEGIYDLGGKLIKSTIERRSTLLKKIPIVVVINDALSGDTMGISDVSKLEERESTYSKIANKDIDSLSKGMDQITCMMDVDPRTSKSLSMAPGALWDLSTSLTAENNKGQVFTLDNNMAYSPALDVTLKRIKASLHESMSIPDVSNGALQGMITSGKTMQAIYWDLTVRAKAKMLVWKPAIREMIDFIIQGAMLYPGSRDATLKVTSEYKLEVTESYAILQDVQEEKASDILEVSNNVMSRKAYLSKWRGLTDEEIDAELKQISEEQQLLSQDSYMMPNAGGEIIENE